MITLNEMLMRFLGFPSDEETYWGLRKIFQSVVYSKATPKEMADEFDRILKRVLEVE